MIGYFKYTDGSAFTLDGVDYKGMMNVVRGRAYTGSMLTSDSKRLSSKGNFISEAYLNEFNFNHTFKERLTVLDNTAKVYSRSILSYDHLDKVIKELNTNNLLLFSKMISYSDDIINLFSKTYESASTVFCLTGQNDEFTSKRLPLVREAPSAEHPVTISRPRSPKSTLFLTLSNKDAFSYYTYGVKHSGNINSLGTPLSSSVGILPKDGALFFNVNENLLYYVEDTKFNTYYYDSSTDCNEFGIIDRIDISLTNRNTNLVSFGKNYRCSIVDDNNNPVLEISNISDSKQILSIVARDIDIDTVISISQRFEDDALAILYVKKGVVRMSLYDINLLLKNYAEKRAFDKKDSILKQSVIYNAPVYGGIGLNHRIEFACFDSDVIFVKLYIHGILKEVQFRSISNPIYPLVVFNGYSKTGNYGKYRPTINNIIYSLDQIGSTFENFGENEPFPILDLQFDVKDTIRCLTYYQDSIEVSHITTDMFRGTVPIDLPLKYKNKKTTSNNNSIGLELNNAIRYIINDTFNLYEMCKSKLVYDSFTGAAIGYSPTLMPSIRDYNLYIYENESLNIGVLDRIFITLRQIQQNIALAITLPV